MPSRETEREIERERERERETERERERERDRGAATVGDSWDESVARSKTAANQRPDTLLEVKCAWSVCQADVLCT